MPIQPKGIILHSMSEYLMYEGQRLYAKDFLKKLGLSVHGFIKPDGTYDKMIESPNKAFHAGKSLHEGLSGLNSHFLGVELLVPGTNDYASFTKKIKTPGTYSEAQFGQTAKVFKFWMDKYNIPTSHVVRHSDVSGDHVRGKGKGKTDPGPAFDWDRFKQELVT
ncbi:N-acetylmuramoyl-L-alanine amidase [bacterium]|jgi:AmpD protein|nr:N-acetylmuramoyl-L-alanine amidase [bacterium]